MFICFFSFSVYFLITGTVNAVMVAFSENELYQKASLPSNQGKQKGSGSGKEFDPLSLGKDKIAQIKHTRSLGKIFGNYQLMGFLKITAVAICAFRLQ